MSYSGVNGDGSDGEANGEVVWDPVGEQGRQGHGSEHGLATATVPAYSTIVRIVILRMYHNIFILEI